MKGLIVCVTATLLWPGVAARGQEVLPTQAGPEDSASRDSAMTPNRATQGAFAVVIGSRARITTAEGKLSSWDKFLGRKPQLVGTVLFVDRDTLVIQPEGEKGRPVTYSWDLIERMELSHGRRPERLKGAAYGAGLGAGAGAAILFVADWANSESPPEQQRAPSTHQDYARWALWGALVGGIGGAITYKEEVWTEATIAWRHHSHGIRGEFGAAPLRSPGMIMFVKLSF